MYDRYGKLVTISRGVMYDKDVQGNRTVTIEGKTYKATKLATQEAIASRAGPPEK